LREILKVLFTVVVTIVYDILTHEPVKFLKISRIPHQNLTLCISGTGSVRFFRLAFSKTKCYHVVNIYVLIKYVKVKVK